MLLSHLFETTNMAAVDTTARRAIVSYLEKFAHDLCGGLDDTKRDTAEDEIKLRINSERSGFVRELSAGIQVILTQIMRQDLEKRFGDSLRIGGFLTTAKSFRVLVTPKSYGIGKRPDAGGYFYNDPNMPYLRLYIEDDDLIYGLLAFVNEHIWGEAEGLGIIPDKIGRVFVHEYGHCIQFIKGETFTRGLIGKKGNRSKLDTDIDWARYLSSFAELDSFASDAASDIVAKIPDWVSKNDKIKDALQSIATGYEQNETYMRYFQFYENSLYRYAEINGVSHSRITKVWHHFLKLLYVKLKAYMSGPKTPYPEWGEWATQGLRYTFEKIVDQMVENENVSYDAIHKAAYWLDQRFFTNSWDSDNYSKLVKIIERAYRTKTETKKAGR